MAKKRKVDKLAPAVPQGNKVKQNRQNKQKKLDSIMKQTRGKR